MKKFTYTFILAFFLFISCEKETTSVLGKDIDFPVAYVVSADNVVSAINLLTLKVDTSFIIQSVANSFAHHIYKSPDSKSLVIAVPSVDLSSGHGNLHNTDATGGIIVLKSRNGKLVSSVRTIAANHNAVFSSDGDEIWTALMSHDSPKVLVYSASDLKLKAEIQVGTDASEISFSSDGKTAFVAAQESSFVYAIDVQTKKVVKQIKVDFFPTNVWPGINRVFVENRNRPSINIINSNSLTTEAAIDLDYQPGFTSYHVKSETLWVCDAVGGQVRLYKKKGAVWSEESKIKTNIDAHSVAFSEKYNLALVVNQRGNSVSVIDLEKLEKINEISVGLKPNGIVIID